MPSFTKDMSASQRAKYNDYHHRAYLTKELRKWQAGLRPSPPHPHKAAPWLLALYRRFNAEHLVVIPMSWMSKAQIKKARNRERYLRSLDMT